MCEVGEMCGERWGEPGDRGGRPAHWCCRSYFQWSAGSLVLSELFPLHDNGLSLGEKNFPKEVVVDRAEVALELNVSRRVNLGLGVEVVHIEHGDHPGLLVHRQHAESGDGGGEVAGGRLLAVEGAEVLALGV